MATTVTIDKGHFETLLRRAEFVCASTKGVRTPLELPFVSISKGEHENLLQIAREYEALKQGLKEGGAPPETLDIIIRNVLARQENSFVPKPIKPLNPAANPYQPNYFTSAFGTPRQTDANSSGKPPISSWAVDDVPTSPAIRRASFKSSSPSGLTDFNSSGVWQVSGTERAKPVNKKRTLLLQNLSDEITHKDIVGAIRGGALVDVFLRKMEKQALVSFAEPSAAQAYLWHVRRDGLILCGKKIDVSFAVRSFETSRNVEHQISLGATRNLMIRDVGPDVTENSIRDDLEHIHGLVVINVVIQKGDALINLNAVHLALFARTCMRSRTAYRKCKIEFYPDECAEPLPVVEGKVRGNGKPATKHKVIAPHRLQPPGNRFQMLSMDGTEDSSEEFHSDSISSYSPHSAIGTELGTVAT